MVATAAPSAPVQCYINRATEFGHTVLAFAAPSSTPPANDTEPSSPPARAPTPEFKWIHVANTGTYKGHHQGEFTLDAQSFEQMIRNFRADPKYGDPKFSAGPVTLDGKPYDGPSTSKIVQFDYEHASEMHPAEGSIPTGGAPAIGWALELDVRQGDDGRAQLWALAKLGDTIRRQIDADEYGSVSIAWNPAGVHWVTGQPIGAVLTSIAMTNHPFIRDLLPLAAANRAAGLGPAGSVQIRAQSSEAHAGAPQNQGTPMTALTADLRNRICNLYKLTTDAADSSVIMAAENAATASSELAGLLKALGHASAADAIGALPDLMASRSKLVDMLAQFDALMRADAAADADVEQQDVAAAFSARRFTDGSLVHALAGHRAQLVQGEIAKLAAADQKDVAKVRAARSAGRLAFLTHYGVATNPAHQHLTSTYAAGPGPFGGSTQYAPPAPLPAPIVQFRGQPGYPQQQPQPAYPQQGYPVPGQPLQLSQHQPPQQPGPYDLSQYNGRNLTERVMSLLSSIDPSFEKLDHGTKVTRASAWRKANAHLIVGAAA